MFRRIASSIIALALLLGLAANSARLAAQAPAAQPQYKGVWEPVSFTEDIDLLDVFFVNASTGWAAGDAGTIIATTDAGASWTAQLGGDPENTARKIRLIRFVDERHGWAVQGISGTTETLLHTSDGQSWEEIGTLPYGVSDLVFTSRSLGFAAAKSGEMSMHPDVIYRTTDGGRRWEKVWQCSAKVELSGLSRRIGCHIAQFNFPSATTGYAVAQNNCVGMGCAPPPLLATTSDGGESWEAAVGPGVLDQDGVTSIFFVDDRTGFARLTSKKLHMTSDGGRTWRGIVASPGKSIRFADPGVGWGIETGRTDPAHWFTTNGGSTWSSRAARFPATVRAYSFPRRDRAYMVGDNGMVFRYSVVPVAQSVKASSIAAPAMPRFDSQLDEQVAQLEQVVRELRVAIGAPAAPAATSPAPAAGTDAPGPDASGSVASDAAALDAITAPLAAPSDFSSGCCGKSFSRLEVVLGAMSKTLPEFIARYKNLNLLLAAVRMGGELPSEFRAVKGGLSAFRKANDRESAEAALASVSAALSALKQTTAVSMQTALPPAGG